jgi:hypothetical protein
LAQRSYGAEPLGLLRFASAPLPNLLEGLRHGFEGMGSPEQTDVRPSDDNSEYLVVDRRYGFLYHPWVRVGEIEPEEVLRREQKHLVFHGMQRLSEPAALRLLSAIRVYGPCTLLWVEQQDPYHPAGAVEALKPGLLKAYINRFAPGDNAHDFLPEAWLEICRRAWPLRNAG